MNCAAALSILSISDCASVFAAGVFSNCGIRDRNRSQEGARTTKSLITSPWKAFLIGMRFSLAGIANLTLSIRNGLDVAKPRHLRDGELVLAVVTHESIRCWCQKFGADFARKLRRRRPKPGDTWHMDEVFLRINGELHYLWRAVDQYGVVLDILVQDRRHATAAQRFFKRLLAGLKYTPKRIVTDGLRSDGAAHRDVLPEVKHRTSRHLNNRAENSHRPTRRRERQMQRFKSPEQAQRFLSSHMMIYGHVRPRRHLMTAIAYRNARARAFRIWRQETCLHIAT
jgi:putative transposase